MPMNGICRACGPAKLAINTNRTLTQFQSITITGKNLNDFEANKGVGKTTAVFARVIPMIRANKLVSLYYDIGRSLRRRFPTFDAYEGALLDSLTYLDCSLKGNTKYDIFLMDDAYHSLQTTKHGSQFLDLSMSIWQQVSDAASIGKQFIFISAYHPRSGAFEQFCRSLPGSQLFIESPVIEYTREPLKGPGY